MLLLADMQISASELRRESRGVFYRSDFPDMDDPNWRKNILIKNTGGRMQLSFRDAGQMRLTVKFLKGKRIFNDKKKLYVLMPATTSQSRSRPCPPATACS